MKTFTNSKKLFLRVTLIVLFILGISGSFILTGQTLTNYTFNYSTGTYVPISGGTLLGSTTVDDELYLDSTTTGVLGTLTGNSGGGFPIGFNFNLNGTVYDRLAVSTNGWIGLGISSMTPMVNLNTSTWAGYWEYVLSAGFASGQPIPLQNKISVLCTDLQARTGSSIRIETIGTAPYRTCVIQWANYRKYGATNDTFNFQIRLNETTDSVNFSYGPFVSDVNDGAPQVGILTSAGFVNRTSSTSWASTTAGSTNAAVITLTNAIKPANGANFGWGMPPKVYVSSTVEAPILTNVGPGSTNEPVVRLKVVVAGLSGTLRLGGLNVNTNGTTSLSEISNLKIFYTDTSTVFSTGRQYSSTIFTPSANNPIIDSIDLTTGNNYFWVTYDVSSSASLGNYIDGAVTTITVGGTAAIPTVTSPAGSRQIQALMTYVGSTSAQPDITKIQRGTTNNKILRIDVQMSATGSPANVTNFDLSTNGSSSISTNITNAKVWYTGSSTTFATTNQFGATSTAPGATFSVTGSQSLLNGFNYFWISYDVPATAIIGDSLDAEIVGFNVAGSYQYPTVTAPAGNRKIRAPYCVSAATATGDEEIWGVSFGTLNNVSTCTTTAPGPGSSNQLYSNYTTSVTAPDIASGIPTLLSVTKGTCGGFYGEVIAAYIDYNQDGVFGTGETVFTSTYATGSNNQVISGVVTVPCTALSGNTLMRIVYVEGTGAPACGTYTWGETEDYLINIVNGPPVYTSSSAIQVTGVVAAGTSDVPILRVPVKVSASPCNPGVITELRFNTVGTTNVANILSAKLYKTGVGSTFNTSNLLGTLTAPSGSMVFLITDTVNNDSNNYWLAYDVSATASNGNVLDAKVDSIQAFGTYYIPANNNPSGNRLISIPMTYIGSNVNHPDISKVETNSVNNRLLRIMIRTSSTGSPLNVTQFSLTTNGGGIDTSNILNAKIWYTGASNTFATSSQFGSSYTVSSPTAASWAPYTITGTQPLNNDTNYFWLTYDIKASAIVGDSVDAELASFILGGVTQTPSTTAPAGVRLIRNPYCNSGAFYTDYDDIGQVVFTQGANTILNNGVGCTPAQSNTNANKQYTNYTLLPPANIIKNVPVNFNICDISGTTFTVGAYLGIFIDYNQNGTFDTGELVYASTVSSTVGHTGTFTIPCGITPGNTRMRIIMQSYNPVTNPCLIANANYYYGETEDYIINITDNPITYLSSTAIQQTGLTAPGSTDVAILRVPVKAIGCGVGIVSEMRFNITGTTTAANILSAKLYKTGNSTLFTNSNLIGQIFAPTAQMVFTFNDTLSGLLGDTNNYWLAYDISSSASTSANFIDATFDSILAIGAYRIPTVSAPAGNKQINLAMTYVSSTSSHPDLSKIERNTNNNRILQIIVNGSATGSPINVTVFDLSTNGSATPDTNITNAKVWYTGSSTTFNTGAQFGSASIRPSGAFAINGFQPLLNGTNVFWVTYDVPATALIGDSVDAEITGITVGGTSQIPTITAPAGSRIIRGPYCNSAATTNADGEIFNVAIGNLNNTSSCSTTGSGPGSVLNRYSNYSNLTATNMVAGLPLNFSINTATCGGNYTGVLGIWADLNGDGDFTDPGETLHMSPTFTYGTAVFRTGTITIPCNANPGETRLRVTLIETGTSPIAPCGTYGYGETEDYLINIISQPANYTSSAAIQITGPVVSGATNVPVLRIPVNITATPCMPGVITDFNFNTIGTTVVANILSAKLYATGNSSTFNTSKLLGTVASPSGAFTFTVTDTVVNDTNNYWLAYDVSSSAPNGNLLDARIDSLNAFGNWFIPANGNPTGSRIVSVPMTYLSSTTSHPDLSKVERGTPNNRILRIDIVTGVTGAPINATNFDFSTNGSATPASNISNAKVWYTGSSNTFAATTQFGSTSTTPSGLFSVTGSQALANGNNYFWLSYDVPATAIVGDSLDAELSGITIDGVSRTPIVTAPAGSRIIRAPYCTSAATTNGDGEILNVTIGNLNNTSTCTTTGGGPGSATNMYSNYSNLPATNMIAGIPLSFSVNTATCGGNYTGVLGIWADLNNDGDFIDAGETLHMSPTFTYGLTVFRTGTITIPCSAASGETRLRVALIETGTSPIAPCGTYGYGETEDYQINIISQPATYISSNVAQLTGFTPNGATDIPVLRIAVKASASSCLPGTATNFNFNTSGTTLASNILSAKLYTTGNANTFNTSKLLGTVASPNGVFTFNITDTVVNDTNNYWLAYDVSSSAANGNLLDAKIDSLMAFGNWYIPANGNPSGSMVVYAPMNSYVWNGSISNDVSVAGNWTPARLMPNVNDKMVFNSGGVITLSNIGSGSLRVIELANATVVKLSAATAALIVVNDSLILGTNCRIHTDSIKMSVGSSTSNIGVLAGSGFIYGNLIRWMNSGNTTPTFPLSDSSGVSRNITLNYTTLPTTYGSLTAAFKMALPGNTGLPLLDAVASVTAKRAGITGFWTLSSTATGGAFTGTFNATGFKGVSNYAQLILLNRATSISSWTLNGTHAATTGSNAAPVLSRTAMNAYGEFAVGGDTLVNPLPVNMLFFTARNAIGDVNLNWATATETNNKGFMLERSVNGVDFTDVVFVEGKGNSKSTTQYSREDVAAFAKAGVPTLYYRLRQVDFDGVITYSSIAVVNENDLLGDDVKVFPNPFETNVGVRIESTAGSATIQLMDMHGRMISEEAISTKAGTTYYEMKNLSNLAKGVYFVRVSINGTAKTIKLTKAN
ncbi:MAG: BNR-repeat neuraminidase N-terminal domain-containing protein [Bacteroidota bacterium]|nr:BNR-repeat neuraminidase N-terminal domain-containing protein [Bacteroidota bacterium]